MFAIHFSLNSSECDFTAIRWPGTLTGTGVLTAVSFSAGVGVLAPRPGSTTLPPRPGHPALQESLGLGQPEADLRSWAASEMTRA